MIKYQRSIMIMTLRALVCLLLLRACGTTTALSNIDLGTTTLDPLTTGFIVTGNAGGDGFGRSVSSAGDIDNDGYDDIIVGAWRKNFEKGVAYVIYGGEKSTTTDRALGVQTLDPQSTGFMITGDVLKFYFGASVSTAGDINKDGFDDIIIGAYGKNSVKGVAYVIYGGPKSAMTNIDLNTQTLDPQSTGFMITGNSANDQFGFSVSTAGDINKDGYDDIIVGAPVKNSNRGAAYVIYGGEKSAMTNIDLSIQILDPLTTGFMITGASGGDYLGYGVSRAGDINKDGYDDIIVGAYGRNSNRGAAYVIYGGEKSTAVHIVLTTALVPATTGFMITGNAANDYFGKAVGPAGDINNDGYDDIIVGANFKNGQQGAAYVVYGGEKSTMTDIALSTQVLDPQSTGFIITGSAGSDNLGIGVNTAGDINNDGYDDIIVGAYGKNNFKGAAYVIYGGEKFTMTDIALNAKALDPLTTGFMITEAAYDDYFGYSVSTAGDLDKDGYDDIVIGAYGKSFSGAAYVIYGGYACPMCSSCPANCNKCSSASVCTECTSPYLLHQSGCLGSCPAGTFSSNGKCETCSTNCKKCSSSSVCTECKSSYLLYQSGCLGSCPAGTFSSNGQCKDCSTKCSQCSSSSKCTECKTPYFLHQSDCLDSCPVGTFTYTDTCQNCPVHCSSCTSKKLCQTCDQGYLLSNSRCDLPPSSSSSSSHEAQEKAIQVISSAAKVIGSIVCIGSSTPPATLLASKTVLKTRYLNISVTNDLAEIYQAWDKDLISWDVPNGLENKDRFKTAPFLFARYEVGLPFLENFRPTLLNIVISLTVFVVCILVQKFLERAKVKGWALLLVQKLIAGSWNFALVQAYVCLDDIIFYLALDIKTNPFNSFFSWANVISAFVFLIIGCLLVFFNFWIVKKYQQAKKNIEAFNEKNKYWKLFYLDFNDDNAWGQSFLAFLIIRSTFSSLIIAVLYDIPLLQTTCLVFLDGVIILFLYLRTPFKTLRRKLAQYYFEIITLLVHLCALSLSIQDRFKKPSDTIRLIMSTAIIYLNTALLIGIVGFLCNEIYQEFSRKSATSKCENVAIPTSPEEALTVTQTKMDHSKNSHLLLGVNQNTMFDRTIESPQVLGSNFNADIPESKRNLTISPQRELTPTSIRIRRKLPIQPRPLGNRIENI